MQLAEVNRSQLGDAGLASTSSTKVPYNLCADLAVGGHLPCCREAPACMAEEVSFHSGMDGRRGGLSQREALQCEGLSARRGGSEHIYCHPPHRGAWERDSSARPSSQRQHRAPASKAGDEAYVTERPKP